MGWFSDRTWGRVFAGRMRGEDSSSVFRTGVCRQLQKSCQFARRQSESVFLCLRLRLTSSSSVFVVVCLRHRLSLLCVEPGG